MVKCIKAAVASRVNGIVWMAPETKKNARKKVETIVVGVGYPESWRDYGSYSVSAGNAYANEVAGQKAEYAHQLAKIGKPMDKGEWWMTRSEEHTSELHSLMRISYAVYCLKNKTNQTD